jgi:Raf kinase inhibitor-like YbhB/YbcL family protein
MKAFALYFALVLASLSTALAQQGSQTDQVADSERHHHHFRVSSTTFTDGGELPLSTVLGSSSCTFVSGGGDQSPELSWEHAPHDARSFVVTLFDVTAAFTHWGMYNISRETTELPENAGVAGSKYGQQVFNDFFFGPQYDGPCPPNNLKPLVHDYVFTVFALDASLQLASSPPNFPADAETLYRAMSGHVIESASIHGFFSSAN